MIVDLHQHYDYGGNIDRYAQGLRRLKIRVCLNGLGIIAGQMGNDDVAEALRKYPDVIIGFYYVTLGVDTPATLQRAHTQGFRGLKFICPAKPYDDRSYYPIYRKAEELRLPCLFHTGAVARADVAVLRDYSHIPEVMQAYRQTNYSKLDIDCKRMMPFCCDTIARAFPKLIVILAHYGVLSNRGDAQAVIQLNPNAYADLTHMSSCFSQKDISAAVAHFGPVMNEYVVDKLFFGTDNGVSQGWERMRKSTKSTLAVLRALKVKPAAIKEIMGRRAEKLFGWAD